MTTNPSSDYDDEIDLRAIFQTLWKARKPIIIATLAAAIIAFVVSFWILPRTYQATAYVFIGQPVVGIAQAAGFTISPTLPDLKAVVKLSTTPELLESVINDPAIAAVNGNKEISISALASMVTAVDVGKDQLSLQVTDTDPQRVILLANTWAEKVTKTVNAAYGLGAVAQTLDSQVLQSQKDFEQAQTVLEDALSKSRVDALSAQLQREQTDHKCVLVSKSLTARVLDDLQFFEQGLSGASGETPLSLGDELVLATLSQRSLTSQPCQFEDQPQSQSQSQSQPQSQPQSQNFTIQIDSASFAGFTVSKALDTTTQMRAGLQAQLTRLQGDQNHLEQEIPQLQRDLSNAQAQLDQFTMKRDQSQELYNSLFQTQQRVATMLAQNAQVATVSIEAVPPAKTISRGTIMNTALAGMLGLILSAFVALAINWWGNP